MSYVHYSHAGMSACKYTALEYQLHDRMEYLCYIHTHIRIIMEGSMIELNADLRSFRAAIISYLPCCA